MNEVTLQINLSPGDVSYAEQTVPALVEAHQGSNYHRLAIVDCCRPQRTRLVDPDKRFPIAVYRERVQRIRSICDHFLATNVIDEVRYLTSDDSELFDHLSRKYMAGLVDSNQTHEIGGTALMSYLAALELSPTRYVLHYDGDMIIYQNDGVDWSIDGLALLKSDTNLISIMPRRCPPIASSLYDSPTRNPGRPFRRDEHGWVDDWYSTRCFMMDKSRLEQGLPLLVGRRYYEQLIRKKLKRGFPRSPEILFCWRFPQMNLFAMSMSSTESWLLHPAEKGNEFLRLLPDILRAVNKGCFPNEQAGEENLNLTVWDKWLATSERV